MSHTPRRSRPALPPRPIPQGTATPGPCPRAHRGDPRHHDILAAYGRHLADTIEHRAVWRGFTTIAQFFGTASLAIILPHLRRGIICAVALPSASCSRAQACTATW